MEELIECIKALLDDWEENQKAKVKSSSVKSKNGAAESNSSEKKASKASENPIKKSKSKEK